MKEFAEASFAVFKPTKISAREKAEHVVLRIDLHQPERTFDTVEF